MVIVYSLVCKFLYNDPLFSQTLYIDTVQFGLNPAALIQSITYYGSILLYFFSNVGGELLNMPGPCSFAYSYIAVLLLYNLYSFCLSGNVGQGPKLHVRFFSGTSCRPFVINTEWSGITGNSAHMEMKVELSSNSLGNFYSCSGISQLQTKLYLNRDVGRAQSK